MIAFDLSLENIYRQYYQCRSNKRNTVNALRFEAEQESNLLRLREQLVGRTYRPRRSVCFFVTRPKLREVFAADFRDRVVHHVLVDYLERLWEPLFIHDSYACRRGKGVHAGVKRLQRCMRQVTANGARPAWYLQLDIRNYFMSIDHDILFGLLAARLQDESALWLTRLLVYHDCTRKYVMKGRPELLNAIPPHKTLFGAAPGKGLPIGNLNSQFFANVYLNTLDQFVKHELKCRHYLRYCDDFVLLHSDREQLEAWESDIERFLADRLALELNPKRKVAPVSNGVDFLGYIVRRDYRLVRRRVVNNLKRRLREYEARLVQRVEGGVRYGFERDILDALAATISSYLGHFKLAKSFRLWVSLWRQFPFLAEYFAFDAAAWKLVRRYAEEPQVSTVRDQYAWYCRRYPDHIVLMQVGGFVEFYGNAGRTAGNLLSLRLMRANRRQAVCGFRLQDEAKYLTRARLLNRPVISLRERDDRHGRIKARAAAYRYAWANDKDSDIAA
jgi:retron-type reverse transcriptase